MPHTITGKFVHDLQASGHVTFDNVGDADVHSQAEPAAQETAGPVHENPWLAAGAAASAGVLLGLLLARR